MARTSVSGVLRALRAAANPMQTILNGAAAAAELPGQASSQPKGPAILSAG